MKADGLHSRKSREMQNQKIEMVEDGRGLHSRKSREMQNLTHIIVVVVRDLYVLKS